MNVSINYKFVKIIPDFIAFVIYYVFQDPFTAHHPYSFFLILHKSNLKLLLAFAANFIYHFIHRNHNLLYLRNFKFAFNYQINKRWWSIFLTHNIIFKVLLFLGYVFQLLEYMNLVEFCCNYLLDFIIAIKIVSFL